MFDINNCFTAVLTTNVLKQAITGDAASVNYIDLGAANLNIAGGKKAPVLKVQVIDAFTTGDVATGMEVRLESDTDPAFGTALKQILSKNLLIAQLTAGKLVFNIPMEVQKYQRYLRVYFNAIGGTFNAGSVIAWIDDGAESPQDQLDVVAVG